MTWISLLIAGMAVVVGITCKMLWPNSAAEKEVEEVVEQIIKDETGIGIDFSVPKSVYSVQNTNTEK